MAAFLSLEKIKHFVFIETLRHWKKNGNELLRTIRFFLGFSQVPRKSTPTKYVFFSLPIFFVVAWFIFRFENWPNVLVGPFNILSSKAVLIFRNFTCFAIDTIGHPNSQSCLPLYIFLENTYIKTRKRTKRIIINSLLSFNVWGG